MVGVCFVEAYYGVALVHSQVVLMTCSRVVIGICVSLQEYDVIVLGSGPSGGRFRFDPSKQIVCCPTCIRLKG